MFSLNIFLKDLVLRAKHSHILEDINFKFLRSKINKEFTHGPGGAGGNINSDNLNNIKLITVA